MAQNVILQQSFFSGNRVVFGSVVFRFSTTANGSAVRQSADHQLVQAGKVLKSIQ
jgi:hypothetical protein